MPSNGQFYSSKQIQAHEVQQEPSEGISINVTIKVGPKELENPCRHNCGYRTDLNDCQNTTARLGS